MFAAAATSWIDAVRLWVGPGPNLVRDLELLILGVRGKELFWKSLESTRSQVLREDELRRLLSRAQEHVRGLGALHVRAVKDQLGGS
jgi:hypothetical protein